MANRLESKKKVMVRGRHIGGERLLICLPIVAKGRDELLEQAKALGAMLPDLVEWRADAMDNLGDQSVCAQGLQRLREALPDLPLIFTCRLQAEGGFQEASLELRLSLMHLAIDSKQVDLVDFELANPEKEIKELAERAHSQGVALILSHHNFERTPSKKTMLERLIQAQELGADIAKLVVTPRDRTDLLDLLEVVHQARRDHLEIPIIAMSMGELGAITRLAAGLFGSDITYAVGDKLSAPGQMPMETLRKAMEAVY